MTQTSERLVVPGPIRDEIIAHARDHFPRECCGILSGKQGDITQLHRLTNLEQGVDRYLFDDEEFYKVYWEIENRSDNCLRSTTRIR